MSSAVGGGGPPPEGRWTLPSSVNVQAFLCLGVACLGSVILVSIVAVLIALMQFQGRLLMAQPSLTAGRLVYFVALEKNLDEVTTSMSNNSKALEREGLNLSKNQNELSFRINRLCAAFATLPMEDGYLSRCEAFLSRIPFDFIPQQFDAMQKALNYDVHSPEKNQEVAVVPHLEKDSLDKIEAKFARYMGDPLIQGQKFSEFEYLYASDISAIAFLNQASALRLQPLYTIARAHYLEDCAYRSTLARQLRRYRDIEELNCSGVLPVEQITVPASVLPRQATGQSQSGGVGGPAPPAGQAKNAEGGGGPAPAGQAKNAEGDGVRSNEPPNPGSELLGLNRGTYEVHGQPEQLLGQPLSSSGPIGSSVSDALDISTAGNNGPGQLQRDTISAEQQRDFDLVSSYRFYDRLSPRLLESLIMSPSEFLALLLVCFGGILGAFLKIIFSVYTSSRDPDFRDLLVGPILGLICALVLYILLRAGFIAITDHAEQAGSTSLSPFVIVFVSLTAGLLSERSVAVLQRSSATLLGASDSSEISRWAVGLKGALLRTGISVEQLAARLRLVPKVVQDWTEEVESVPAPQQRDLSLILDTSPRLLFTDLPPS
ncbi:MULTISPECIES: hypothetical protein [unclassified Mesorhizobium]|uniref:hypothetical protein n=1 Tax=unclassified Mesorhizobium TaxID=325217 RepID=UPI00112ACE7A|nr:MULTISPECIES: hypothetical protein [unclassified Mesorhizobium]TPM03529.1 hypothetical protein FJ939_18435 [Mesorhizobium sp. B2-3-8]TPM12783.1 hypothetical protein FJ940_20010 [Mesorhizobium sp. B2-3-7]